MQSAAYNPYEYDFPASVASGVLQMALAGGTTLAEADGDVCYGIVDYSSAKSLPLRGTLAAFLKVAAFYSSMNVPLVMDWFASALLIRPSTVLYVVSLPVLAVAALRMHVKYPLLLRAGS